jgi:DNA phosphorothioation-associated putative methyltransferase
MQTLTDTDKRLELTAHWKFPRQKAAQKRHKLSSPITAAIGAGILTRGDTLLDYGTGRGDVPRILNDTGYYASGFDPYYFPNNAIAPADIVNLSFVLAVIECPKERDQVLKTAWSLTQKHLIVSAQVQHSRGEEVWGDGFKTRWQTFCRYWTSPEFKKYIQATLNQPAKRIGKGIFVVSS